jgi:hypothetical protein
MRVQIEGDIYLSGDGMGYSLEKRTIGQSGKSLGQESFKATGHYSNIGQALSGLQKLEISESTATTLSELAEDIQRTNQRLEGYVDMLEKPFKNSRRNNDRD